jgi:F-type H+-transporting ATPase subunit gamma
MQTVESLRRRIKTAEDLQSLVKTMKALAAVNIRQYEKAVESLAGYMRTVEMGLRVLLRQVPEALAAAGVERSGRLGAIVFGSDQGMCGQLNDQIVSYALEDMEQSGFPGEKRSLLTVGLRVAGRLEEAGQHPDEVFPVPDSTAGITPMVQEFLLIIEKWHSQEIDGVSLFFCEHLGGASYRPSVFRLLPVDALWLRRIRAGEWPSRCLPAFTMDWNRLFSRLLRQYFFVSLYRAFAESLASENASRLASMQGAEKNIEERLAELNRQFHQQRQMAITGELLDIVSGYEALASPRNR